MTDIDARLGHLRPTSTPDPEGFERAHARLLAACERDAAPARDGAPPTPGHLDLLDVVERVDVVVPMPDAARRRRRIVGAAAASAVVLAGVVLWPRVAPFDPAAASNRCEQWVADHASELDGTRLVAVLAAEQDGTENVMLAGTTPDGALAVSACTFDGTEAHPGPAGYGSPGWLMDPDPVEPAPGDVVTLGAFWSATPDGEQRDGTSFVAGRAGADVVAVTLHFAHGGSVEAVVGDGYWAAWYHGAGAEPPVDLTWTLRDGTSRGPAAVLGAEG